MHKDETLRVLQLVNHDNQYEMVRTKSGIDPIILNRIDLSDPDYINYVSKQVFSDGTGADFIAKCQCGAIEGNDKIDMYCSICESTVSHTNLLDDDNLICQTWLEVPKELPHGWLTPKVYLNLAGWLSYDKGKRNYLDDILDVTTPIPMELTGIIKGKGFNYLAESFDQIMNHFIFDHPTISKKADTPQIKIFLNLYRHMVFCHYIPVLNSAISPLVTHEIGSATRRQYSDTIADSIIKAAISLSRLEYSPRKRNLQFHVEKTAFEAYKNIIEYIEKATKTYISIKKAIPRTHIFGSRYHWSIRGVVTPIIGPHVTEEIWLPWRMTVNTLRVHIYGVLLNKYGMSLDEVFRRHRHALQKVDPLINQIIVDLIKDSGRGLPFLWDRPPSIRDGSVMVKFCTRVKTDIDDSSIDISPNDIALPNGDFDGDNFAGILLIEADMVEAFKHLMPPAMVYNKNNCSVTSEVGMHKTTAITWNRFLGNIDVDEDSMFSSSGY